MLPRLLKAAGDWHPIQLAAGKPVPCSLHWNPWGATACCHHFSFWSRHCLILQ